MLDHFLDDLSSKKNAIAVIGLGYVGFPMATLLAQYFRVIGFDIDAGKIALFKEGIDPTNEVGTVDSSIEFSSDPTCLKNAKFFIVCVPTPTNVDNTPDLKPLVSATNMIAQYAPKGSIAVYESTVYPGVTRKLAENLEQQQQQQQQQVFVGYSPERINPGDNINKVNSIMKLVAGENEEVTEIIATVYRKVIDAGIYTCSSLEVAEMAKLFENTQRDVNIALANELGLLCDVLGIPTYEVLNACSTKWNFTHVQPGFVGGHCIATDPYYYLDLAESYGQDVSIVRAARTLNQQMPYRIAQRIIAEVMWDMPKERTFKVGIFGATFKENVNDFRNTGSAVLYNALNSAPNFEVFITDPLAEKEYFEKEYAIKLLTLEEMPRDLDVIVLAVKHRDYYLHLQPCDMRNFLNASGLHLVYDIKGMFGREDYKAHGLNVWMF